MGRGGEAETTAVDMKRSYALPDTQVRLTATNLETAHELAAELFVILQGHPDYEPAYASLTVASTDRPDVRHHLWWGSV